MTHFPVSPPPLSNLASVLPSFAYSTLPVFQLSVSKAITLP